TTITTDAPCVTQPDSAGCSTTGGGDGPGPTRPRISREPPQESALPLRSERGRAVSVPGGRSTWRPARADRARVPAGGPARPARGRIASDSARRAPLARHDDAPLPDGADHGSARTASRSRPPGPRPRAPRKRGTGPSSRKRELAQTWAER